MIRWPWLRRAERHRRILAALPADGASGFEITKRTGIGPARLYADLAWLEQKGRITSAWETPAPASRPRRRLYFRKLVAVGTIEEVPLEEAGRG